MGAVHLVNILVPSSAGDVLFTKAQVSESSTSLNFGEVFGEGNGPG
jgi:hypothetical protein